MKNMKKYISSILVFALLICPIMRINTAIACNGLRCNGSASAYSGPTSVDLSSTCGICDNEETAVRTRTVAHCIDGDPTDNCSESAMTCERSCSSVTVGVSPEQMDICNTEAVTAAAIVTAAGASCALVAAGACVAGCAYFAGPAVGACSSACIKGVALACAAGTTAGLAIVACEQSDCKYNCESTGWSSTDNDHGCS